MNNFWKPEEQRQSCRTSPRPPLQPLPLHPRKKCRKTTIWQNWQPGLLRTRLVDMWKSMNCFLEKILTVLNWLFDWLFELTVWIDCLIDCLNWLFDWLFNWLFELTVWIDCLIDCLNWLFDWLFELTVWIDCLNWLFDCSKLFSWIVCYGALSFLKF